MAAPLVAPPLLAALLPALLLLAPLLAGALLDALLLPPPLAALLAAEELELLELDEPAELELDDELDVLEPLELEQAEMVSANALIPATATIARFAEVRNTRRTSVSRRCAL